MSALERMVAEWLERVFERWQKFKVGRTVALPAQESSMLREFTEQEARDLVKKMHALADVVVSVARR